MLSWQVSVLITAIWLFSLVFRKAQPAFHYWLWSIVIVRLILPLNVSIPTGISQYIRSPAEMKISEITKRIHIPEPINKAVFLKKATDPISDTSHSDTAGSPLDFSRIIVLAWFGVSLILLGGTVAWTWHVRTLVKRFPVVTRTDVRELFERKSRELGIKKICELYSMDISMPIGPTVIGIFNPKILLPNRIIEEWSIKEIEPVLIHELVHIQRRDLLINWIQIGIQIVYFFHPLVWFANWKIREIREEICDDLTIKNIENKRRRYSVSILNILEGILYEPIWGYIDIGFSERKSSLAKRIIRIANKRYQFHKPLDIITTVVLLAVSVVSVSLSCDYSPEKIIGITPAAEKTAIDIPSEILEDRINIIIREDGTYEVNGIVSTFSNLENVLKRIIESGNKKDLFIISNDNTPPITIFNTMKVSKKVGIDKIGVIKK